MAEFHVDQTIHIPCEVANGAFVNEALVTFETSSGPISGFVNRDDLVKVEDGRGYIPAVVQDVSRDTLTVIIRGSFFTTTGLAYLSQEWARENAEVLG